MGSRKGTIALMGSGELTSTMVEVHKDLLGRVGGSPRAVFLDTPAGFQLNVDDLAQRAVRYFLDRVRRPMGIVSFKSKSTISAFDAENAYHALRTADYVLMGPGSPTYAVSQWRDTPIPEILIQRIEQGGCLVAASAAALTVGRFTLPVYEIYKVGEELHWVEGLDLLDHFGFPLVVIPHWNNAEGGTHDTRFCYMGEPRFQVLESQLSPDVSVLGLDEHTACLLDLEGDEAVVKGIGGVTLRRNGREIVFEHGERFPLDILRGGTGEHGRWQTRAHEAESRSAERMNGDDSFWSRVRSAEAAFEEGVRSRSPEDMTSALLELDRTVWQGQQELESAEFVSQARERFRELVVRLGAAMKGSTADRTRCVAPVVETFLRLRERFRQEKRWSDADLLRRSLHEAGVVVEDTHEGAHWKLRQDEWNE